MSDLQNDSHPSSPLPQSVSSGAGAMPGELDTLLQAGRAAEQLHARFTDLQRQEAALESRRAELEELQQFTARERAALELDRQRLDEQTDTLAVTRSELDGQRLQHERAWDEIATARETYRSEVDGEIEVERGALRQLQDTLEQERQQLNELRQQDRDEHASALLDVQKQLESERLELKDKVRDEVAQETIEFQRERTEWEAGRTAEVEEIRRQAEEVQRQREQFAEQMQQERERFQRDSDSQQQGFQQEQAVLARRYRFQLDHLEQARADLQVETELHRREERRLLIEREQEGRLFQLRKRQLERYHDLLLQREESVNRERGLLHKARSVQTVDAERDHDQFSEQRDDWNRQREAQQSEMERQQQVLALHAENLERRRQRLDSLKREVEDAHAATLEERIAIEEVMAQLSQLDDSAATQQRVAEVRQALSEHHARLRDDLARDRDELTSYRAELERQQQEFREERRNLTEWIATRDDQLRMREERLNAESAAADVRESQWRQARDGWNRERAEAEGVIRDLLRQLTDAAAADLDTPSLPGSQPAADAPTPPPADEVTLSDDEPTDVDTDDPDGELITGQAA